MLSMLVDKDKTDYMSSKMKEIYDLIYGYNTANLILDEPEVQYEYTLYENYESLLGKNYRINVYTETEDVEFVFLNAGKHEEVKQLKEKLVELGFNYRIIKFPNRKEPEKLIFDFEVNQFMIPISELIELLKVR